MLNLDALNAIAFDKGCYTGQEVIARAHYRGRVKRRMQRFVSLSRAACQLSPGDSGQLGDGRTFKVVRAAQLADGRCDFLAVAPLGTGSDAIEAASKVASAAPDAQFSAAGTAAGSGTASSGTAGATVGVTTQAVYPAAPPNTDPTAPPVTGPIMDPTLAPIAAASVAPTVAAAAALSMAAVAAPVTAILMADQAALPLSIARVTPDHAVGRAQVVACMIGNT